MSNAEDLNRLTACSLVLLGHIFYVLGNHRVSAQAGLRDRASMVLGGTIKQCFASCAPRLSCLSDTLPPSPLCFMRLGKGRGVLAHTAWGAGLGNFGSLEGGPMGQTDPVLGWGFLELGGLRQVPLCVC